jgi:hypothetical protein
MCVVCACALLLPLLFCFLRLSFYVFSLSLCSASSRSPVLLPLRTPPPFLLQALEKQEDENIRLQREMQSKDLEHLDEITKMRLELARQQEFAKAQEAKMRRQQEEELRRLKAELSNAKNQARQADMEKRKLKKKLKVFRRMFGNKNK